MIDTMQTYIKWDDDEQLCRVVESGFSPFQATSADTCPVPILSIYLDKLSRINRTFGYVEGDLILEETYRRLLRFKGRFYFWRGPGPLFVLLPLFIWNKEEEKLFLTEVEDAFTPAFLVRNHYIKLKGLLVGKRWCHVKEDSGEILRILYRVIQYIEERNLSSYKRIWWYDEIQCRIMDKRFFLEEEIKKMINEQSFDIYLQPQYRIEDGTTYGGEILSRWSSEERGNIPPDEFIPIIIESGQIINFTIILIKKVLVYTSLLSRKGNPLIIAVNIPAHSLLNRNLIEIIQEAALSLKPHLLEIELTEDSLINLDMKVIQVIKELRRLGVRIALDDFGTGFSNLKYLMEINVDTLKIDRSFISSQEKETSFQVIRAIIGLAHSSEITVIAEGVETEEQLAFLERIGCDVVQGYLYSEPRDISCFINSEGILNW